MLSSKFVGFYEKEVNDWARKLGTADAVIALWFEVQRKWQYLESIFVGSDDIRSQLPEDSKRFDGIDKTFKVGKWLHFVYISVFFTLFFSNEVVVCLVLIPKNILNNFVI